MALGAFLLVCGVGALLVLASDLYYGYDLEDQEEREFKKAWKDVDDGYMFKVLQCGICTSNEAVPLYTQPICT